MKTKILLLLLSFILLNCSKDEPNLSPENKFLLFEINQNGKTYEGQINNTSNIITIDIGNSILSNSLKPIIKIPNKAEISPSQHSFQNYNEDVVYTITAENGDTKTYTVKITSSEKKISAFSINFNSTTHYGTINQSNNEITINTKGLEKHTAIIPNIIFSTNAAITPSPLIAQNFNDDIIYTVTALDGTLKKYKIIINNTPLSSEKKITKFDFNIDGEIYTGSIDHSTLTINIETNRHVSNINPIIEISENAVISPGNSVSQNFNNSIEYKVTAEDGTENIYTVNSSVYIINGTYGFSNQLYYKNGIATVSGFGLNINLPNSSIILENDQNSYTLTPYNFNIATQTEGEIFTSFNFTFPDNIVTSTDYKLKYKINNETKVESRFSYDVIADNVPVITSSNQKSYKYNDTLILYGENLENSGLYIHAYNGSIYSLTNTYLSINTDKTELTHTLNLNSQMFPSYYGEKEDYPTRIEIKFNGRSGMSYIVDFD